MNSFEYTLLKIENIACKMLMKLTAESSIQKHTQNLSI